MAKKQEQLPEAKICDNCGVKAIPDTQVQFWTCPKCRELRVQKGKPAYVRQSAKPVAPATVAEPEKKEESLPVKILKAPGRGAMAVGKGTVKVGKAIVTAPVKGAKVVAGKVTGKGKKDKK